MDQACGDPPKTTLTEFLFLCQRDDFAKTLLYLAKVPALLCRLESIPYDHAFGALTSGCAPYDRAFGTLVVRPLSITKV